VKKQELEKCPQWLLDANTNDENVEWGNGPESWIVWRGGVWQGGVWQGGVWWGGDWQGGDWQGGVWRGGVWQGGDWQGGASSIRSKYTITIQENGFVSIGCKTKSIPDWIKWFAGKEEFETKRDTVDFQMIHAHFLAVKAYAKAMQSKKEKKS